MNDLPVFVPCWRQGCKSTAAFENMERYPKDLRPVYGCACGAKVAVHADELPEYIIEFGG